MWLAAKIRKSPTDVDTSEEFASIGPGFQHMSNQLAEAGINKPQSVISSLVESDFRTHFICSKR